MSPSATAVRQALRRPPWAARRTFTCAHTACTDFSHVVIGGGVVGTAIAAELSAVPGTAVLLVEQHAHLATETTSRNSEVIHAGLYYPRDSLKAQLCIRGKNKIYQAWQAGRFQVDLQQCGKWVVAQNEDEAHYLENLARNAADNGVPVSMVSPASARQRLPLIRAAYGALESPTTGIISAHDYTVFFQGQLEHNGGTIGVNSTVVGAHYDPHTPAYTLTVHDESGHPFEISTDNLVNAAGLHAQKVANMLLPPERHLRSYFAKGTYYSYEGKARITDKLIYPCPNPNASSLGTHLTFDLGGQLKFGPDLEWLDVDDAADIDYTPSALNVEAAYQAVERYFPQVREGRLVPSYAGVRPKIFSAAQNKKSFADFIIREEEGFPGFVNLVGIESPGLTAAWAIGEHVKDIYYK